VNYHCQRFTYSNEGKGAISIVSCEEVKREEKQRKRERKREKMVYFRRNVTREFKLDVVNIAREKKIL